MTKGPSLKFIPHFFKQLHSGRKPYLEAAVVAAIVGIVTFIKLWHLGEKAFVHDETIHVLISKYFVTQGYNWEQEVAYGAQHMPLQYFIMGWSWLLAQKLDLNLQDEFIFRLPSVIMSSLTIPLVYLMGKRWGYMVALSATMFFAFHPYVLVYTRFASLDFPSLFWFTLGLFFYFRSQYNKNSPIQSQLLLSGIFFGISGMTKVYSLIILAPIFIHSMLLSKSKTRGALKGIWDGIKVILVTLVTFVLLSAIFTKDPFQLYNGILQILHSLDTVPSATFSGSLRPASFAWDTVKGARQVLITLWTHLGWGVFLISLIGMFRLLDEDKIISRIGIFFLTFVITTLLVFAPFHFPRYILVMGTALPFLFAFGLKETIIRVEALKKNKFSLTRWSIALTLIVLAGSSILPLSQLSKLYSFQVVDDWTYVDGMKKAALYIKDKTKPGEWILTNGHYTVIKYYSGFPSDFYMGIDAALRVYTLYDWDAKRPITYGISWQREKDMRYIVIDHTPQMIESVMFRAQMWHSFSAINPQLISYLNSYTRRVASIPDGNVEIYERISRNLYSQLPQPEIWVGEGGAEWKDSLASHNGWTLGVGWGQTKAITSGNETYWARTALRDGNRFADFILPIRDITKPATLEIIFQDMGTGEITINTLLREPKGELLENFLRPLGDTRIHIQLTNSGVIKTATIPLHPQYYFDTSADMPGHQQHFSFFTQGSAIQVIKVGIVQ